MNDPERDKLAQETHQALLGIPGTEDKGLVGDVKAINVHLKEQNASILKNTIRSVETAALQKERNKPSKKAMGGLGAGVLAIGVALWRAFTNGG